MSDLGPVSYCVAVLWMHGESLGRIAKAVKWSRSRTWGFVNRQFKNKRGKMTIAERQVLLDEMKGRREDGDRLKDSHFIARPLEPAKSESKKVEDPDLNTREGRREARRRQRAAETAARTAEKKQEQRELGHAARRGRLAGTKERTTSSALEYLFDHRILRDAGEESKTAGREGFLPEESRRLEAGLRMRALIQGARSSDLGAIDYERATMGAGGGPKLSLAAFKLHCIQRIGTLRKLLPRESYIKIEAIVDGDRFIWETEPAGSKRRRRMYEFIRYWLDIVGVHESLLTREAFHVKWKFDLPIVDRVTKGDAAGQAARAAEVLESARG